MGMFDPVIDNSPVDKYGAGTNATSLMTMAGSQQNRANELYDMNSTRNQMFKQSAMEDAFDVQAQQSMFSQRQAARSGQAFTPAGMDSSSAVRSQVQKQWGQQMMAQQAQSGSFMGQASSMQGQAGNMRNSLNQMYRQQQQANQQAKQQAKAAKLSVASGLMGAIAGPALGALGGGLGGLVGGGGFKAGAAGQAGMQAGGNTGAMSSGGTGMFGQAMMNQGYSLLG